MTLGLIFQNLVTNLHYIVSLWLQEKGQESTTVYMEERMYEKSHECMFLTLYSGCSVCILLWLGGINNYIY